MGKPRKFAQGARRYERKQRGYNGQTKPIANKKLKTSKKLLLKLECPNCKTKMMKLMKRAKHVEIGGSKKIKGEALIY